MKNKSIGVVAVIVRRQEEQNFVIPKMLDHRFSFLFVPCTPSMNEEKLLFTFLSYCFKFEILCIFL